MKFNANYELISEILSKSNIGMWAIEIDKGVEPRLYADETMRRLLGIQEELSPEELFHVWYDNIHPDYLDVVAESCHKMIDGIHTEVHYSWYHKDVLKYTRSGGIRNYEYEAGIRLEGSHQDVSELVHIRRQERRKQELISCLTDDYDAVFYVNPVEGKIQAIRTSQFFKNFYTSLLDGMNYKEFLNAIAESLVPQDKEIFLRELQLDSISRHFENEYYFYHSYRILKGDVEVYYQLKLIHGDSWNKDRSFVIGVHNMDKRTREEMAHRKLLDAALNQAEAANVAKTTFLFNMSHDIRTPMNAIIGFTDMARKHIDDRNRVEDCLGKVKKSSEHLLALINDVLDMSRIESGSIVFDEKLVDVRECLEDLKNMVINLADEKHIKLSIGCKNEIRHPHIYADELRVNRILINIINNSIKYTNSGGSVSCFVEEIPGERKDRSIYRFTVEDTGIGMSEEFLKHMYEPFSRENNSTVSGIVGTGLGLSITRELVEKMGGTIEITSKVNVGTRAVIEIQFIFNDLEPIEKKGNIKVDPNVLKGKRILVVEDNDLNREIAVDILEDYGIEVEEAMDGSEAVVKYKHSLDNNNPYWAILMDVQMPVMDGYEATKNIRKLEKSGHIPIIAMTANAFAEDREKALKAGMDDHLPKPVQPEKIFEALLRFNNV